MFPKQTAFFRKKNKTSFLKKYTLQSSVLRKEDNTLKTVTKIHLHLQILFTCGFNSTKIFVSGMVGAAGKKSEGSLLSYGFPAPGRGHVNRSLCCNTNASLSKKLEIKHICFVSGNSSFDVERWEGGGGFL